MLLEGKGGGGGWGGGEGLTKLTCIQDQRTFSMTHFEFGVTPTEIHCYILNKQRKIFCSNIEIELGRGMGISSYIQSWGACLAKVAEEE